MSATVVAFLGAVKYATSAKKLVPYLGMNVVAALLTPVLLRISIISG